MKGKEIEPLVKTEPNATANTDGTTAANTQADGDAQMSDGVKQEPKDGEEMETEDGKKEKVKEEKEKDKEKEKGTPRKRERQSEPAKPRLETALKLRSEGHKLHLYNEQMVALDDRIAEAQSFSAAVIGHYNSVGSVTTNTLTFEKLTELKEQAANVRLSTKEVSQVNRLYRELSQWRVAAKEFLAADPASLPVSDVSEVVKQETATTTAASARGSAMNMSADGKDAKESKEKESTTPTAPTLFDKLASTETDTNLDKRLLELLADFEAFAVAE